ncbi:MAG: sigma-70 family RNA polymerase sigma factor [Anaerolineales bacterium]|nr:sigma-70 family RNA polymerase sigma factor [Anaerolineales bacterium]
MAGLSFEPAITDTRSQELVARAQRGDVNALGQLYDQHQAAIFRYLWLRLDDRAMAEDLTGEVFLRMMKALAHYRAQAAPFRAWLYRIARNLLVDHWRKGGPRAALPLTAAEDQPAAAADPVALVDRRLSLAQLRQALERLDEAQREVVTLRFLAGLSLQETAAALEKTEAAIKALQHRGLAALRQALADRGESL